MNKLKTFIYIAIAFVGSLALVFTLVFLMLAPLIASLSTGNDTFFIAYIPPAVVLTMWLLKPSDKDID